MSIGAISEGLKLSYVDDVNLRSHINKVMTNYNVLGIPTCFLIYATAKDFKGQCFRPSGEVLCGRNTTEIQYSVRDEKASCSIKWI